MEDNRRGSQSGIHMEFHDAVLSGDQTLFQFYLRHYGHRKLLIDSVSQHGFTALQQCCLDGKTELVKSLIEAGSSLEKVGKHGRTALHCAAISGNLEIVTYLVNSFANVYAVDEGKNYPVDLAESTEVKLTLLDFMRKRKVSMPARSISAGPEHTNNNNLDISRRHSLQTPLVFAAKVSRCPQAYNCASDEKLNEVSAEISSF